MRAGHLIKLWHIPQVKRLLRCLRLRSRGINRLNIPRAQCDPSLGLLGMAMIEVGRGRSDIQSSTLYAHRVAVRCLHVSSELSVRDLMYQLIEIPPPYVRRLLLLPKYKE